MLRIFPHLLPWVLTLQPCSNLVHLHQVQNCVVCLRPVQDTTNPALMAAALRAQCACMHDVMRAITDAVESIAATPEAHPSLRSEALQLLQGLHPAMAAVTTNFPNIQPPHHSLMQSQHAQYTHDFVTLLNALVPQLARFGSAAACVAGFGSAEEAIFWNLWSFLASSCGMLVRWPDVWDPSSGPAVCPDLFVTFRGLLLWLLQLIRSPAWTAMKQQHGSLCRGQELHSVLACLLQSLIYTTRPQLACTIGFPSTISQDLISLLCCIASEHFGTVPSLIAVQQPLAPGQRKRTRTRSAPTILNPCAVTSSCTT